jgi:phosphoribosyl 1,2-cyclic phosphate phosphodiesterase
VLIEQEGAKGVTRVLVDAGPDLREQLIDAGVEHLDGVVITHEHADHTHGVDDLRPLVLHMRKTIDTYMDAATSAIMRQKFGYIFETPPGSSYPPILVPHVIEPGRAFTIEGAGGPMRLLPLQVVHGEIPALALKVGGVVYMPDVSAIPPDIEPHLAGLDVLILDALRPRPHPTHFNLKQALDWIARTAPREAVLTNLHCDLDYAALAGTLPERVRPAHDGLVIRLQDGAVRFA